MYMCDCQQCCEVCVQPGTPVANLLDTFLVSTGEEEAIIVYTWNLCRP